MFMRPDAGELGHRPNWGAVAGVLVVLMVVGLWFRAHVGRAGAGAQQDVLAVEPASPTLIPSMSATSAMSGPATKPATSPAIIRWSPPRFRDRQEQRDVMVRTIRDRYGLKDKAILDALTVVPRHEFVPERLLGHAHDDSPLPIGYGQTISQPYIVAEMTRLLALRKDSRVLEIGTGSGYQAAVLTEFTPHVYSIEIIGALAQSASERLRRLGYTTVCVRHADGYYGWEEQGPFDAIIVTCAAGQIPPPLLKQLAPGGRMAIPVGPAFATQSLMLVEKGQDGAVRSRSMMSVGFVPLLRADSSAR